MLSIQVNYSIFKAKPYNVIIDWSRRINAQHRLLHLFQTFDLFCGPVSKNSEIHRSEHYILLLFKFTFILHIIFSKFLSFWSLVFKIFEISKTEYCIQILVKILFNLISHRDFYVSLNFCNWYFCLPAFYFWGSMNFKN